MNSECYTENFSVFMWWVIYPFMQTAACYNCEWFVQDVSTPRICNVVSVIAQAHVLSCLIVWHREAQCK